MTTLSDRAQAGLTQIEDAILELLELNKDGLTNIEIARALGLGTPPPQQNMLSWELVGRLVRSGRVERSKQGRKVVVRLPALASTS